MRFLDLFSRRTAGVAVGAQQTSTPSAMPDFDHLMAGLERLAVAGDDRAVAVIAAHRAFSGEPGQLWASSIGALTSSYGRRCAKALALLADDAPDVSPAPHRHPIDEGWSDKPEDVQPLQAAGVEASPFVEGAALDQYPMHPLKRAFLDDLAAARAGDGTAQYRVGLAYRDGFVVDADLQAARRWLERALRKGVRESATALAEIAPDPPARTQRVYVFVKPKGPGKAKGSTSPLPELELGGPERSGGRQGADPFLKLDRYEAARIRAAGVEQGRKCAEKAFEQHDPWDHAPSESVEKRAFRLATSKGLLDVTSDAGMAGLCDGSDPLFEEHRVIFIRAVKRGIKEFIEEI